MESSASTNTVAIGGGAGEAGHDTATAADNTKRIDLGAVLWDMVGDKKYEEALEEIKKNMYQHFVINNSMDLIPVLTLKLQDIDEEPAIECIESMLVHIATVAKVKEVMIVLLEEVQIFKTKQLYRVMLKPLEVSLCRQISLNCNPALFSCTFKSVLDHMARMELPAGYNLEGKERKLLDADPCVQALSDNLHHVVDFFNVFYQKIILSQLKFRVKIPDTKVYMAKTLLGLFDKPLTFLDVYSVKKNDENSIYRSTSKLLGMIIRLYGNPVKLFAEIPSKQRASDDKNTSENDEDEDNDDNTGGVSQTSLATFFYCIFHQHMSITSVPCVYHPLYKFVSCLPLVCQLLAKTEHLAVHKGLLLTKRLVDGIDKRTVTAKFLDAPCHSHFTKFLVFAMTMVDNKEIRLTGLHVFRRYVANFDYNGRYKLFESLLQTVTHAGLLGFIITDIKQNIAVCLKESNNKELVRTNQEISLIDSNTPIENKFTGSAVWKLVYVACHLPDREFTDLLDMSDKILSALNLVLFLLMRAVTVCDKGASVPLDTTEEITDQTRDGLISEHWQSGSKITETSPSLVTFKRSELPHHIQHFKEELFTPLQKGLGVSQLNYQQHRKSLQEGPPAGGTVKVELSVMDSLLPGGTPEEEANTVGLALSRLDLISCVLTRVEAVADELLIKCA